VPDTHRYALVPPAISAAPQGHAVLTIEELSADAAYGDERIVYRPSNYRLEYYNYHLWSTPPPVQLSDYLRQAYTATGLFARVTRQMMPETTVLLNGRVTALEEVDASERDWYGRVRLELELTDPRTGDVLWSRTFEERERLERRHPAGLAKALSIALLRVVQASAPAIARVAEIERVAGRGPGCACEQGGRETETRH
jgi:ABC-type uncharacterized transport system auxiliary subunit